MIHGACVYLLTVGPGLASVDGTDSEPGLRPEVLAVWCWMPKLLAVVLSEGFAEGINKSVSFRFGIREVVFLVRE